MEEDSGPLPVTTIARGELDVRGQLGAGGLAVVSEAYDQERHRVALRQLRREYRFRRKQKAIFNFGVNVRRLLGKHANIVQYYGQGSHHWLPYEVIEFVPGDTLKKLILNKHAAVWDHGLYLLRQAAAALCHVHEQGFLHLDVKSENFFVLFDRGMPIVKLTDFDLCVDIKQKVAGDFFGGSLPYLPPEYLQRKEIGPPLDIFSFGVMAYNLFTFAMPFVGSVETALRDGQYELRFPSDSFNRCPPGVEEFLRRCLAPTPKERYGTMMELFLALETLRQATVKMRRPSDLQGPDSRPRGDSPPARR